MGSGARLPGLNPVSATYWLNTWMGVFFFFPVPQFPNLQVENNNNSIYLSRLF